MSGSDLAVAQEIVDFWFGKIKSPWDEIPKERVMKWYRGGKEYDDLIRDKYEDLMIKALDEKSTEFDSWKSDPIGLMALVLMADQFSRNIYRGTADTFKYDDYAQTLCKEGITLGIDFKLMMIHPRYTYFFYHPLLHAENLEGQLLFQQKQKEYFSILDQQGHSARKHFQGSGLKYLKLIQDFGRFPHRNEILGRKSSPEELKAINEMAYNPLKNKESDSNTFAFAVLASAVVIGLIWYIAKRR